MAKELDKVENLGKAALLGSAAEKLANTVGFICDVFVGPEKIKKIAKARGQSAIIEAYAKARIKEIEERAIARVRSQEERRQANIESITLQAAEYLPTDLKVSNESVEADWVGRFFGECQDISDKQMQSLWAKILAGEVRSPNSFSPRTLRIVKDLTKEEANLFAALCKTICTFTVNGPFPIVRDVNEEHLNKAGLNFASLTNLKTIGLIDFNNYAPFHLEPRTSFDAAFGNERYLLSGASSQRLHIGTVVLTNNGAELFSISNAETDEHFKKAAINRWTQEGWKVQRI